MQAYHAKNISTTIGLHDVNGTHWASNYKVNVKRLKWVDGRPNFGVPVKPRFTGVLACWDPAMCTHVHHAGGKRRAAAKSRPCVLRIDPLVPAGIEGMGIHAAGRLLTCAYRSMEAEALCVACRRALHFCKEQVPQRHRVGLPQLSLAKRHTGADLLLLTHMYSCLAAKHNAGHTTLMQCHNAHFAGC